MGITEQVAAEMPHECGCRPASPAIGLDKIVIMFGCAVCHGFSTALVADLDGAIQMLEMMRERRFDGQVVQRAGQAPEVRSRPV
jgi:hypothetical protein